MIEELSLYLDGEADEATRDKVQHMLETSAEARQMLADLQEAGRVATRPNPPELPSDFAARTAVRVLETRAWWELLWERLTGSEPGTPEGAHPVTAFLAARSRRAASAFPGFAFVALLFGIPGLFLAGHPETMRFYAGTTAIALMIGLPWYYFRFEVSLLTSLRRGRCLEDLLCAGLEPRGIVDTLATHSVRAIVKLAVPALLVLLPCVLAFPVEHRPLALGLGLAWLPATLALFWVGSYVTQFLIAWSRRGEGTSVPQVGLALLLFGVPLGLGLAASNFWGRQEWALAAGLGVSAVIFLTVASRGLAIWALQNASTVDKLNEQGPLAGSGRRNRWVRSWSENPIVARERCRHASATPGGLAGVVAGRALAMALPALWAVGLTLVSPEELPTMLWGGLAALVALMFLRGAQRTLGAVVGERERGTWEALLQTGISAPTFTAGWVQVAALPLLVECLPGLAVMLAAAVMLPHGLAESAGLAVVFGAMGALCLLLAPAVGALVGLGLSARSGSHREAGSRLVLACLSGLLAWLALWGIGTILVDELGSFGVVDTADGWYVAFVQRTMPLAAFLTVLLGGAALSAQGVSRRLQSVLAGAPEPAGECRGPSLSFLVYPAAAGGLMGAGGARFLLDSHLTFSMDVLRIGTFLGGLAGLLAGVVTFRAAARLAAVQERLCCLALGCWAGFLAGVASGIYPLSLQWGGIGLDARDPHTVLFCVWGALGGGVVGGLLALLQGEAPRQVKLRRLVLLALAFLLTAPLLRWVLQPEFKYPELLRELTHAPVVTPDKASLEPLVLATLGQEVRGAGRGFARRADTVVMEGNGQYLSYRDGLNRSNSRRPRGLGRVRPCGSSD